MYLASLDENALWGGEIEGQCRRIEGDSIVTTLGIHCYISEMLQFVEETLPEV